MAGRRSPEGGAGRSRAAAGAAQQKPLLLLRLLLRLLLLRLLLRIRFHRPAAAAAPPCPTPLGAGSSNSSAAEMFSARHPVPRSSDHFRRIFSSILPGFHRVLPGFTEFYRVLQGLTGFYRVLPSFTGFSIEPLKYERAVTEFLKFPAKKTNKQPNRTLNSERKKSFYIG